MQGSYPHSILLQHFYATSPTFCQCHLFWNYSLTCNFSVWGPLFHPYAKCFILVRILSGKNLESSRVVKELIKKIIFNYKFH